MVKISDLRMREVINVVNGKRLGIIKDIELDLGEGMIKSIILPGVGKLLGLFGRNDDIVVPWENIDKIGVDVILVHLNEYTDPCKD